MWDALSEVYLLLRDSNLQLSVFKSNALSLSNKAGNKPVVKSSIPYWHSSCILCSYLVCIHCYVLHCAGQWSMGPSRSAAVPAVR